MTRPPNRTPRGRAPEFLSGVIAEPTLLFGGNHEHVDPKTGLALYGPHCPAGLARPALSSMIVGAVGPPAMIADASAWIEACAGILTNAGDHRCSIRTFLVAGAIQLHFFAISYSSNNGATRYATPISSALWPSRYSKSGWPR